MSLHETGWKSKEDRGHRIWLAMGLTAEGGSQWVSESYLEGWDIPVTGNVKKILIRSECRSYQVEVTQEVKHGASSFQIVQFFPWTWFAVDITVAMLCLGSGAQLFSCVRLCHPVDWAHPAPLCVGFPRQEYWSGLPFRSPGALPDPGIDSCVSCIGRWILYHCCHLGSPKREQSNVWNQIQWGLQLRQYSRDRNVTDPRSIYEEELTGQWIGWSEWRRLVAWR